MAHWRRWGALHGSLMAHWRRWRRSRRASWLTDGSLGALVALTARFMAHMMAHWRRWWRSRRAGALGARFMAHMMAHWRRWWRASWLTDGSLAALAALTARWGASPIKSVAKRVSWVPPAPYFVAAAPTQPAILSVNSGYKVAPSNRQLHHAQSELASWWLAPRYSACGAS